MDKQKRKLYPLYFLIPGAVLYFVFFVLPTFSSFYYSLTDWNLTKANYVGLDNFRTILNNPDLSIGFRNTAIFTFITLILKVTLGLAVALLVNSGLKTQNFLRGVFFFPVILSAVAVGLMFTSIFHPTHGLINATLIRLGMDSLARDWLGDPSIVMYSVSLVDVWKGIGYDMVIILAGLQSVPKEYHEAIAVDGGNPWQSFINITLPLIRPALNSCIVLNLIGAIRMFDIVQVTTKGGPGFASQVIGTIIYREFADGYFGIATAAGVLLFMIVTAVVFPVQTLLSRREVEL